jgi:hypothetical protein
MKSSAVLNLKIESEPEIEMIVPKEEIVPPWRKRLRWWLAELLSPPRIVRLVGPNSRPLERHEFESPRRHEINRVL